MKPATRATAAALVVLLAGLAGTVLRANLDTPEAGLLRPDDAEMVALGAEIYAAQCAACHGVNLEGQANWQERGPDGLLPAPPHDETGHTWHHPDAQLFAITKYGTSAMVGGGYRSAMIGFGEVLSDDEIIAVLSYIKSTWPARVRAVHDERNALFEGAR